MNKATINRTIAIVIALLLLITQSAQAQKFFTNFESGSIGEVEFVSADTINIATAKDPLNPIDTLVKPSSRWFYFLMTGVKDKTLTIKMIDTDPKAPVYSYDNKTWHRLNPQTEAVAKKPIFTKTYERDSVYIAYYVPYTNAHLEQMMEDWQYKMGVSIYSIGKSHQGREMKMLMVTNPMTADKNKKRIYIHGRIHPSETPTSWCLEGLIEALLAETPYAKALRDNAIFYILPFTNPDGVALGYSRCDAIGVNMEINYAQPDSLTRPEVKNIKKFIETTTYGERYLDMALNFHSQIAPHFTYWIHTEETTSSSFFKEELAFAALTISDNPYANNECLSFSNMAERYIEGYFWDTAAEKTLALTHETPYSYYNREPEGEWVTIENLKWLGEKTLWSISDYLGIENPQRYIIETPRKTSKCEMAEDFENVYLGNHYYVAAEDGAEAEYRLKKLPAGEYSVYKWITGAKGRVFDKDENRWEKLYDFTQSAQGKFELKLTDLKAGQKINALLLVKKESR